MTTPIGENVPEIEVHVIRGDDYDEWFVLPSVPRVGDFLNTGAIDPTMNSFKVAEVYWLPLGTAENTNSHVAIFLEITKRPDGKKPHVWKNR